MSKAVIIGSPNSGKSLLFNKLTGLNHKVANFPGITIGLGSGKTIAEPERELIDLPGVYSLQAISNEERLAVNAFKQMLTQEDVDLVICILDSTRIEKGLFLTLQVIQACQKAKKQVVVVANMLDTLKHHAIEMDVKGLSEALKVPVVMLSAKTGEGLNELTPFLKRLNTLSEATSELVELTSTELRQVAKEFSQLFGLKGDFLIRSQAKLDSFFLHSFTGGVAFFLIMFVLFQSIFTWAAPAMDAVEAGIGWTAENILRVVPQGMFYDFLNDAMFGGLGAFLVFVPQIFVLTLIVGMLEDSGYLARAAVICHKPLRYFGLTGKSFVPMLSGVACAIPGIYAARTIDSPVKRWLTYFAVPLMPCSARLPVYALLIAAFIPEKTTMGGLIGLQGLAMFVLYFFGIFCGLLVTAALAKSRPSMRDDIPFVLEMPPYRVPGWLPIIRSSWDRSKLFITKAGGIIFTVTVAVWFLGYFPNHGADLGQSWLGSIGHVIEPIFAPLGLDWRYGVAIITSFLAREVFVGTLGAMMGIEGADENIAGLADQIQADGLGLASGVALVVFFAIALQCVSTMAVLKKESGSWRLPVQMFVGYSILAYVLAFTAFGLVRVLI